MARIDLKVPFAEKNQAMALGARWDRVKKTWYAPASEDAMRFARWHQTIAEWVNRVDGKGNVVAPRRKAKAEAELQQQECQSDMQLFANGDKGG